MHASISTFILSKNSPGNYLMNGRDGVIKQSARWHLTLSKIDESIVLVVSLILDSIMFN